MEQGQQGTQLGKEGQGEKGRGQSQGDTGRMRGEKMKESGCAGGGGGAAERGTSLKVTALGSWG